MIFQYFIVFHVLWINVSISNITVGYSADASLHYHLCKKTLKVGALQWFIFRVIIVAYFRILFLLFGIDKDVEFPLKLLASLS